MKKVYYVFLVLFAVCVMSTAVFAAEHTMMISTDKNVYEVGEKFNVSVVVKLATDVVLSGICSAIGFDTYGLSVDKSPTTLVPLLSNLGGKLQIALPDIAPVSNVVGGSVGAIFPVMINAGTYVTLQNVQFEAIEPGTYELTLPEDEDNPGSSKASALLNRTNEGLLILIPSTKIPRTITIKPPSVEPQTDKK